VPELVRGLAQEAGFVVAVDSGGEDLRSAGLVPQLLIGDFDSLGGDTLMALEAAGAEVMGFDAYKDVTDFELALRELRSRGFAAVVATKVLGGRIDHGLAALACLAAAAEEGTRVVIAEEDECCVLLSAGDSAVGEGGHAATPSCHARRGRRPRRPVSLPCPRLHLDFAAAPPPRFISLIPWGGDTTVSVSGVEWELEHAHLPLNGSRGVSNVVVGEDVRIEAHQGTALVVLEG
jgi:thiamine pyrophosphokinase